MRGRRGIGLVCIDKQILREFASSLRFVDGFIYKMAQVIVRGHGGGPSFSAQEEKKLADSPPKTASQ